MRSTSFESIHDRGGDWDQNWASLNSGMVQLYTRHKPRTIHQFWHRCYFEDLWNLMGPEAPRARYLEIGAGRGTTSMYLASKGCDVTMLDLSLAGFEVARENFLREHLPCPKFVQADARRTNLPSETFDCVVSIGLLEHFEDPRPVLLESVRLLRPGGLHFAVIIPTRDARTQYFAHGLFCPWMLAYELMPARVRARIRKARGLPAPHHDSGILRTAYSRSEYIQMVNGLDVVGVRCVPYNPYHAVYGSIWLESHVSVPLYRLHRVIKRLYSRAPLTTTQPVFGLCDLLTFRKRREHSNRR